MNAPISPPPSFLYAPMFPLGSAATEWKRLDLAGLHTTACDGTTVLRIAPEILSELTFRAFRDVAWERDEARNDFHRLAEEAREHLAIVEALLARDAKEAARAMARHIHSGLKYWSRAMPASSNGTDHRGTENTEERKE